VRRVKVCECHIEIKGYLLTYLLTYFSFEWDQGTAYQPCFQRTCPIRYSSSPSYFDTYEEAVRYGTK